MDDLSQFSTVKNIIKNNTKLLFNTFQFSSSHFYCPTMIFQPIFNKCVFTAFLRYNVTLIKEFKR